MKVKVSITGWNKPECQTSFTGTGLVVTIIFIYLRISFLKLLNHVLKSIEGDGVLIEDLVFFLL